MSAIFISHSSKDAGIAGEIRGCLVEAGHDSIFLDFDPAYGIPAGRNWERELYAKLRACRAVIAICSDDFVRSQWCFAEITQARALGKPILPVRLGSATLWPVLSDLQVIDFSAGAVDAYQRLFAGLRNAGLDEATFHLPAGRSPYPGLLAFEESDAAVYFGRDSAIQDGLEMLNRVRRLGVPRSLLILGASGSGKSSLVRAGLIPRLKRYPAQWVVVEPFRPLRQPFDEMALALAATFKYVGVPRDWNSIRAALDDGAELPNATGLFAIANDLRSIGDRREALVLLVVDQLEEVLTSQDPATASRFFRLLRHATEIAGNPFVLVCTLRSDFLGALQNDPAMQGASYETLLLGRMGPAEFAQVIEGPARVVGLDLGPGLVQGMIDDTAANDALPLLAFTLRELWTRYGGDGLLTLAEYDKLGRLSGSVAVAAKSTYDESALSPAELHHLRKAFRALVRVDAEGQVSRQPARWVDLPADVHPILERFVQARLLVSRGDGAERLLDVAHEALFRSWSTLREWLEVDRRLLIWREQLREDRRRWDASGQDEGSLLRGQRLLEAEGWVAEHSSELADRELGFIEASIALRERDRARRERQRRRVLVTLGTACAFFLALSGIAGWQWLQASKQRKIAQERGRLSLSRQLAAQARAVSTQRFDSALLAALAGYRVADTTDARSAVLDVLVSQPRVRKLFRDSLPSAAFAATLSPDGATLATGGCAAYQDDKVTCGKGVVQRWNVTTGALIGERRQAHANQIDAVAFLEGGDRFATASAYDGSLVIWDSASGAPQPPIRIAEASTLFHSAFSGDGRLLAVGGHDGSIAVWDVPQRVSRARLVVFRATAQNDDIAVASMAFSADGARLAAGSTGGEVALIDLSNPMRVLQVFKAHAGWVDGVALDPGATLLATAGRDTRLKLWRLVRDGSSPRAVDLVEEDFFALSWSPDGQVLAAAGESGVRMWRMPDAEPLAHPVSALGATIFGLEFGRDSRTLVANGGQGMALLMNADAAPHAGRALDTRLASIASIGFSQDGRRVALGGCATARDQIWTCKTGGIEVWDLSGSPPSRASTTTVGTQSVSDVIFLADASAVRAAIGFENALVSWSPGSKSPAAVHSLPETVRGLRTYAFGPEQTVAVGGCGRFRDAHDIYCNQGRLELWDAERGVMTGPAWVLHREEVSAVTFDASGAWIAIGSGDGEVAIWDRARAAPVGPTLRSTMVDDNTGSESRVSVLTFSPDGQWLVGGTEQGLVVWDFPNRRLSFSVSRGWGVSALAFSSDGSRLAFNGASQSGDAVVWDMRARTNVFPPFGPLSGVVDTVSMSPDGAWLAAADRRGRVVVWHVSTDEPDVRACEVLGHSFTREDVRRLLGEEPIAEVCPGVK